jgi:hypothetical protein
LIPAKICSAPSHMPSAARRRVTSSGRTMTKKPIRRYTVDGKLMTPDDLRRLRDYLSDIEVVEVISDEMRVVVESEWPEFIHKLPPRR